MEAVNDTSSGAAYHPVERQAVGMVYGVRYKDGGFVPATNRAQAERVASNLGGKVVLILDVSTYEDDQADLPALRQLGPDVGEPDDARTVAYVSEELQRRVMEAIARYPGSGFGPDGKVHGLAAVAAIKVIEDWLLE